VSDWKSRILRAAVVSESIRLFFAERRSVVGDHSPTRCVLILSPGGEVDIRADNDGGEADTGVALKDGNVIAQGTVEELVAGVVQELS
jgi:hypothetical protein